MNQGRILRIRLGHDANCSGYTHLTAILTGFLWYAALVIVLIGIQAILQIRGLADRLYRYRMLYWVIPQVAALVALLVWAFASGAMGYLASMACVGVLLIIILVGLVVGSRLIGGEGP